jgi:hypothetical protein
MTLAAAEDAGRPVVAGETLQVAGVGCRRFRPQVLVTARTLAELQGLHGLPRMGVRRRAGAWERAQAGASAQARSRTRPATPPCNS